MADLEHGAAVKKVYIGMVILAVITLIEVIVSLFGKGHIIPGLEDLTWVQWVAGIIIILLSVYKAYYIVYEFMHMRYEAKALALTVLIPLILLVWAIIAFFQEGTAWGDSRDNIKERDEIVKENYFIEVSDEVKEINTSH